MAGRFFATGFGHFHFCVRDIPGGTVAQYVGFCFERGQLP